MDIGEINERTNKRIADMDIGSAIYVSSLAVLSFPSPDDYWIIQCGDNNKFITRGRRASEKELLSYAKGLSR